jgi:hypothetical protein
MKTIEQLLHKNKDVVDIIYLCIHKDYTKQLLKEYHNLSTILYGLDGPEGPPNRLFYSPTSSMNGCFNWRSKQMQQISNLPIFRISHKDHTLRMTDFRINYNNK